MLLHSDGHRQKCQRGLKSMSGILGRVSKALGIIWRYKEGIMIFFLVNYEWSLGDIMVWVVARASQEG